MSNLSFKDMYLDKKIESIFEILLIKATSEIMEEDTLDVSDLTYDEKLTKSEEFKEVLMWLDTSKVIFPFPTQLGKFRNKRCIDEYVLQKCKIDKIEGKLVISTLNNKVIQGITNFVEKQYIALIAKGIYSHYKEVGQSIFLNKQEPPVVLSIDRNFELRNINETLYTVGTLSSMQTMFDIVVDCEDDALIEKMRRRVKFNYLTKNRVSNSIKNKQILIKKFPLNVPVCLSKIKNKLDSEISEEQLGIIRKYDAEKKLLYMDVLPIVINTRAGQESMYDAIVGGESNSYVKGILTRKETYNLYSLGVEIAFNSEEKILTLIETNFNIDLVTYSKDKMSYYTKTSVPYTEFVRYVLIENGIKFDEDVFNKTYGNLKNLSLY